VRTSVVIAALAAAVAVPNAVAAGPRLESPRGLAAASSPVGRSATTLETARVRALDARDWRGGRFETAGGGVTVEVSPAYASADGAAKRWAEFFASLVHGPELGRLTAYFAPRDEVHALCGGGDGVLGCYGSNRLVAVGETTDGITPESVAAHEYGHHVAASQPNAPWSAPEWGTKRWATAERVCTRVRAGTAFPGDESQFYGLNPGEAFAESYRVLNEMRGGAPATWPIADPSFLPDAAVLDAVYTDVVSPWSGPTVTTIHGRFAPGQRVWATRIATPLDGTLAVRLTGASAGLDVLDGRTVLTPGSWAPGGGRTAESTVCGQRTLVLRVVRAGRARSFALRISRP